MLSQGQGYLFHRNCAARVFMKLICHSTKWKLDPFFSCIGLLAGISTTLAGRADITSILTTFVGTEQPTKFVGTE